MKDKRKLLKYACLIEFIYVVIALFYYIFICTDKSKASANIFHLIISLVLTCILFNQTKKDINYLKQNKILIIFISIWFLLDSIAPGILGFMFLNRISDKKKKELPKIESSKTSFLEKVRNIFVILVFSVVMFILPLFIEYNNTMVILSYVFLFLLVVGFNFKYLKHDFKIFIKNKKSYIPFIIKRYGLMLIVMLIVARPIYYLNKGNVATNQNMLNEMFKESPILIILLTCLYAPIVEEGIFRLSLGKVFNNKYVFIILSGIIFGALHVIDKSTSFYDFLYIIQYSALGICLAKAYKDSNNIFVSISMHFIQNSLAALIMISKFVL